MPGGGLVAPAVGERPNGLWFGSLVAVVLTLLAGLYALDRAAGLPPCLVPLGVVMLAARRLPQRSLGVVELELLAVVLHGSGGLPPGAPTTDRLRHRPERVGQIARLLELGECDPLTRPQCQLPGDLKVGAAGLAVAVPPCPVLLLRGPGLHLGLGGPLGLPDGQRPRRLIRLFGVAPAAEPAASVSVRMLGIAKPEWPERSRNGERGAERDQFNDEPAF
jgi:hypothetical protein